MFRFKHQSEGDDPPRIRPGLRPVRSDEIGTGTPNTNLFAVLLLILLTVGVILIGHHLDFGDKGSPTVINEDGEEVLSPKRQAKLDKELDEIDNAVQYALIASADGNYPCYSCPNGIATIFFA